MAESDDRTEKALINIASILADMENIKNTMSEIKDGANKARDIASENTATVESAIAKLNGDIGMVGASIENVKQLHEKQAQEIRAELWSELYKTVWKQTAVSAAIIGTIITIALVLIKLISSNSA